MQRPSGPAQPQAGYGASDPLAPAKHDSVSVVLHNADVFVFGGWATNRVWRLNLQTACWTEIVTGGDIPPARVNHSTVVFNGFMIVTGGELLVPPKVGYAPHLSYFELSLDTLD